MRCTCLAWHLVPLIRSHLPVRTPPARGRPTYARCSFSSGGRACLRHLSIPSRIVRCRTVLVFTWSLSPQPDLILLTETHFTVFLLEKWDLVGGARFSWAITIPLERDNNILLSDEIIPSRKLGWTMRSVTPTRSHLPNQNTFYCVLARKMRSGWRCQISWAIRVPWRRQSHHRPLGQNLLWWADDEDDSPRGLE